MTRPPWWHSPAALPYFALAFILAGCAVLSGVWGGAFGWTAVVTLAILSAGMVWCAWMAAIGPHRYDPRDRDDDEDQQQ